MYVSEPFYAVDKRLLRVALQNLSLLDALALSSSESTILGLSLDEQADPWILRGHMLHCRLKGTEVLEKFSLASSASPLSTPASCETHPACCAGHAMLDYGGTASCPAAVVRMYPTSSCA